MTADTLARQTCKDLARMAKQRGVPGWHGMRKDQLIQALMKAARKKATARRNGAAAAQAVNRRRIDAPGEIVRNGDGGPQVQTKCPPRGRTIASAPRQLRFVSAIWPPARMNPRCV